ncbi:MAG: hypothetical protein V3U19_03750 [Thermodesulfobacteriota bacterium]
MVLSFDISTPQNTPLSTPQTTEFGIDSGVLVHWNLIFPVGSGGYLYVLIRAGGSQIIPINRGQYFRGDNTTIGGRDFMVFKNPPFKWDIISWNLDPLQPHRVMGHFHFVPIWSLSPFSENFTQLIEEYEFSSLGLPINE